MTRVWSKAPGVSLLVCAALAGPASAQFKPPEFQYTPPPVDHSSPISDPDYFRRGQDSVKQWSDEQDRKGQQKLDQDLPWLKTVSDFQGPSSEQITIASTVLLFTVMAVILLWFFGGALFRRRSGPTDAAKPT